MSKLLKIIVNLFLICAILVGVAILVPPLLGVSTTVIDTPVLDTNLPVGSITYARDVSAGTLVPGDAVLKEQNDATYKYIIKEKLDADSFRVQDAVFAEAEEEEITLRNMVSRVIVTVPFIGYVLIAMQTTEGIIIIGLLVLAMIILFILSELWKRNDDEDDEDEDDEDTEEEDSGSEPESEPEPEPAEEQGRFLKEEPLMEESVVEEPAEEPAEEQGRFLKEEPSLGAAEEPSLGAPEPEPEAEAVAAEIEEAVESIVSEETAEAEAQAAQATAEIVAEEVSAVLEMAPEEEDLSAGEMFIPIERATLEEIIEQAKKEGDNVTVTKDEVTGIHIVDYSEVI